MSHDPSTCVGDAPSSSEGLTNECQCSCIAEWAALNSMAALTLHTIAKGRRLRRRRIGALCPFSYLPLDMMTMAPGEESDNPSERESSKWLKRIRRFL